MPIEFSQFHLLRAELLWLLVPTLLALYGVRQLTKKQSSWQKVISSHLLKFLMVSAEKRTSHASFWLTGAISVLIIFAISGPSFRQQAVPVFQSEAARVILLDLSLSMDATDIKPSRITRAKHKIMDLLEKNNEGSIGLVVYAGDAFVISPLSSDANTIASMIPTLSTGIMPVLGSRPDIAMNKAIALLDNAKQTGQIIWITDGIDKDTIDLVSDSIANTPHLLSILAVGTEQGAPIPLLNNNGFLKDTAGNIILPKLESAYLKQVSINTNGQYVELSANSDDIEFILSMLAMDDKSNSNQSDERINRWIDDGYWLSWIILTLMLFKLFQPTGGKLMSHGGILLAVCFFTLAGPQNAKAFSWDDLWKTPDQQAKQAFDSKDYKNASKLFNNEQWKASAEYKQGDYQSAAQNFSPFNDVESTYNRANSLAKAQQLQAAIDAYDQVIKQSPDHQDALFNKAIVEKLLKQQQEQEKQKKDQENNEQQEQQENEEQQQNDSDSNSDSQSQQDQKNKEQDQNNKDKDKNNETSEPEKTEQEKKQAEEKQAQLTQDQRDKTEKDQALEHWLEKIPDDPGGLLRRKMYREYQRRGRQQKEKKIW